MLLNERIKIIQQYTGTIVNGSFSKREITSDRNYVSNCVRSNEDGAEHFFTIVPEYISLVNTYHCVQKKTERIEAVCCHISMHTVASEIFLVYEIYLFNQLNLSVKLTGNLNILL